MALKPRDRAAAGNALSGPQRVKLQIMCKEATGCTFTARDLEKYVRNSGDAGNLIGYGEGGVPECADDRTRSRRTKEALDMARRWNGRLVGLADRPDITFRVHYVTPFVRKDTLEKLPEDIRKQIQECIARKEVLPDRLAIYLYRCELHANNGINGASSAFYAYGFLSELVMKPVPALQTAS